MPVGRPAVRALALYESMRKRSVKGLAGGVPYRDLMRESGLTKQDRVRKTLSNLCLSGTLELVKRATDPDHCGIYRITRTGYCPRPQTPKIAHRADRQVKVADPPKPTWNDTEIAVCLRERFGIEISSREVVNRNALSTAFAATRTTVSLPRIRFLEVHP